MMPLLTACGFSWSMMGGRVSCSWLDASVNCRLAGQFNFHIVTVKPRGSKHYGKTELSWMYQNKIKMKQFVGFLLPELWHISGVPHQKESLSPDFLCTNNDHFLWIFQTNLGICIVFVNFDLAARIQSKHTVQYCKWSIQGCTALTWLTSKVNNQERLNMKDWGTLS